MLVSRTYLHRLLAQYCRPGLAINIHCEYMNALTLEHDVKVRWTLFAALKLIAK